MFKYLLITFCTLFLISCSTDTFEEDLVESNENLFPTSYFSHTLLSKSLPALSSDIAGVDVLGCLGISSPRLLRLGLG